MVLVATVVLVVMVVAMVAMAALVVLVVHCLVQGKGPHSLPTD